MEVYMGIWVDHEKAFLVRVNKETLDAILRYDSIEVDFEEIKSNVEKHVRLSGGSRTRNVPYGPQEIADDKKLDKRRVQQLKLFYNDIIDRIRDAGKIFIFGPGEAKLELKKEIERNNELASRIQGVETTDKMTPNQIKAKVIAFYS